MRPAIRLGIPAGRLLSAENRLKRSAKRSRAWMTAVAVSAQLGSPDSGRPNMAPKSCKLERIVRRGPNQRKRSTTRGGRSKLGRAATRSKPEASAARTPMGRVGGLGSGFSTAGYSTIGASVAGAAGPAAQAGRIAIHPGPTTRVAPLRTLHYNLGRYVVEPGGGGRGAGSDYRIAYRLPPPGQLHRRDEGRARYACTACESDRLGPRPADRRHPPSRLQALASHTLLPGRVDLCGRGRSRRRQRPPRDRSLLAWLQLRRPGQRRLHVPARHPRRVPYGLTAARTSQDRNAEPHFPWARHFRPCRCPVGQRAGSGSNWAGNGQPPALRAPETGAHRRPSRSGWDPASRPLW